MDTIAKFEAKQLATLQENKEIPAFSAGDTVKVNVRVTEGTRSRIQAYEGVCIARSGTGLQGSFTVRKISYGEGVERVFPLYAPIVESIELVRRGSVRRAKLYYMRERSGKSARIAERTTGHGIAAATEAKKAKAQAKKDAGAKKKAAAAEK